MTKEDFTKVGYWVDLAVKGAIGIVVTLVGLDYRSVKDSLKELDEKKQLVLTEVAILKAAVAISDTRLDRIERKVDRLLELVK